MEIPLAVWEWRLPLYREAHVSVRVDGLTPGEAVGAIVEAAPGQKS